MTKKTVTKVSEKLARVNDSFSVNLYDNGFMIEVSGQNRANDYVTAKIVCHTPEELHAIVKEIIEMDRAE